MKIADHLITTDSGKTRHGLYAGGGNVITLQGLTSRSVIVISLKEFAKHQTCFIRSYPFRPYSREDSLQRAYECLSGHVCPVYFHDQEQFVAWCIKGGPKTYDDMSGYAEEILEPIARIVVNKIIAKLNDVADRVDPGGTIRYSTVGHVVPMLIGTAAVGYGVKKLLSWRK